MCSKRFFMLCVVLVLALASVMAWPVTIKKPTTIVESINEKATELEAISTETSEVLTNSSESETPIVDEEILELEGKKALKGDEFTSFVEKYSALKTDVYALVEENEKLVEDNTKLLKEKKSKFFADLGLAFGFDNKALQFGFAGDAGMRFGSSLMGKLGVTYMFGSFSDIKNIGWNIDNLTVSATVGWEW